MKLINSFFNLYNNNKEKIIRTKRLLLRLRRLSSNKIYLSKGEFKHSNNNVLINIYIFNKQKHNYLFRLKNLGTINTFTHQKNSIKLLKSITKKGLNYIKKVNQNKYLLIKTLNIIELNKNYRINLFNNLSNYTIGFYKNLLNLTMKKLHLYFIYKQLIYINRSKFNYTYLHLLKKYMEKLYNKNVEFNLINLKRFYLNSDILAESTILDITYDRGGINGILKRLRNNIKIKKKKLFSMPVKKSRFNEINNSILLSKVILNGLKYKHVTGFKLEAKGRLSRRFTASRSVYKMKYKGNLLNIDSSYRGLSSVILKGNLKSHIQYTKLKSKTRIGAFGLKGWISGN